MITPHDPERWARIQELFHRALQIPERERYSWLLARCGRDLRLWREVAPLLAADAPTTWRQGRKWTSTLAVTDVKGSAIVRSVEERVPGPAPLFSSLTP